MLLKLIEKNAFLNNIYNNILRFITPYVVLVIDIYTKIDTLSKFPFVIHLWFASVGGSGLFI